MRCLCSSLNGKTTFLQLGRCLLRWLNSQVLVAASQPATSPGRLCFLGCVLHFEDTVKD